MLRQSSQNTVKLKIQEGHENVDQGDFRREKDLESGQGCVLQGVSRLLATRDAVSAKRTYFFMRRSLDMFPRLPGGLVLLLRLSSLYAHLGTGVEQKRRNAAVANETPKGFRHEAVDTSAPP